MILYTNFFSQVSQATIFILTWRSRLDPNREDLQAAQGDPIALKAYKEFHSAINHAKSIVKRGLLIDFHGFNKDWVIMFYLLFTFWSLKQNALVTFSGYKKYYSSLQEVRNRTEVGYLISKGPLNDGEFEPSETSFRSLVKRKNLDKRFFLGNESLGALLEREGYFAVPSPNRFPGNYLILKKLSPLLRYNWKILFFPTAKIWH